MRKSLSEDRSAGSDESASPRPGNPGIIVQARMGSTRLPGKSLRKVMDKPLLQYLLEKLAMTGLGKVVVATSRNPADDAIERFASHLGFPCLRGDELDVSSRFSMVVEKFGFDVFARVCGDSPLLDPGLLKWGFELFQAGNYDLVTNIFPRSFPHGQSVEILRGDTYLAASARFEPGEDREHITRHYYRNAGEFRVRNFLSGGEHSGMQQSVDTPEDFDRFARLVESMIKPHWEYRWTEIADLDASLSSRSRNGK